MSDLPINRQVALASAKWYMPLNRQLLRDCELRPLPREADSSDEVLIEFRPTIAFPTALPPKSVLGEDPMEMRGLFFSPLVVRLHYVAQLSTTYLRANIDAKHCRLSHALGTLCNLSALMDIIVTRMRDDTEAYSHCKPTKEEIVAAFTYAALHDAFQGPFGHALDTIREELVGGMHENRRLDKTLLNFIVGSVLVLEENSPRQVSKPPFAIEAIHAMLAETVAKPFDVNLASILRWILNASSPISTPLDEACAQRRLQLGWLHDLLEGPLDADRWDYLWRDTLHLGFTKDHGTVSDLLRDFWDDVRVTWDGTRSRITVSELLSKRLGSGFFSLRKSLYKNVYENPEKRLIDCMLTRCIQLGILSEMPRSENWATHDQEYLEFLLNLVHITDSELLSILEGVKNPLLAHFARELRTYPAVRAFWQEVLREEEIRSVLRFGTNKLDDFEYRGIFPPAWSSHPLAEEDGMWPEEKITFALDETYRRLQVRPRTNNVVPIGADYLPSLLLHCAIMPKRPARVLQFERLVWRLVVKKLLRSGIIEKISQAVRDVLASSSVFGFAMSTEVVSQLLDDCPPVFVSFPWMASFSESSLEEMAREPSGGSAVFIRRENGRVISEKRPSELMMRTGDSETYVAVAGYPLYITNNLSDMDRDMLEGTAKWAIKWLLAHGCCLVLPREFVSAASDLFIINWLWPKV
jgi:HD superfamily phosphohydrolase